MCPVEPTARNPREVVELPDSATGPLFSSGCDSGGGAAGSGAITGAGEAGGRGVGASTGEGAANCGEGARKPPHEAADGGGARD